ncbi:hypothetical protein [Mycobacterium sp. 852002-51152_SCH6134967]|uniref:hypothetical protein n=1 Tax=Mycobacterium sp. 852002-51152_SCH6134967 TaxID=1834096 RepID=UPI001E642D0A|nr:hypothetical protein [Mycobacterium sp. 852002-51152_SCH6134967]
MTISATSDGGGNNDPTPSGETFGLASADDTGPANIITEDPTCAAWTPINQTFGAALKKGWDKRDVSIPATDWSPELRAQYEGVAEGLRNATDETVRLAKQTPHRVMRELYEQFIAYGRAFRDAVPTYTEKDNHLVAAAITSTNVLVYICSAIRYGSAEARFPLVDEPTQPSEVPQLEDPNHPSKLLTDADRTCSEWDRVLNAFNAETKAWQALDPNLAAADWTEEQRTVVASVVPKFEQSADEFERLASQTSNLTLRDLANFAAQYRRAYAEALPTYIVADSYLDLTAYRVSSLIYEACKAVGQ